MIRGHVALIRLLRSFVETSGIPWSDVTLQLEHDEDGRIVTDDTCAQISFSYHGHDVDVVIHAPSPDKIDGVELMALGKLAARCEGKVIKGPIDPSTWNTILQTISK